MDENQSARASASADTRGDQAEFTIKMPNLGKMLEDMFPEDFRTHMRAAQREQLLAMRSLIDAAIERIDRPEEGKTKRGRGRVEIAVE
jgi:hypothetical protein